jgi:hypothetical protein
MLRQPPARLADLSCWASQGRVRACTACALSLSPADSRPDWLSKPAWLHLGVLRAFPLRQMHRLAAALRSRELPLEQPIVALLCRLATFSLGPLSDAQPPRPVQREAWEQPGGLLATLAGELLALAEELRDTPRQHGSILLLGSLASHLAGWSGEAALAARRLAAAAALVADRLQPQLLAAGGDGELSAVLRARQARQRAMAVLCFAAGPLELGGHAEGMGSDWADGAAALLRLRVQLRQCQLFQADGEVSDELRGLYVAVHSVMAAREAELAAAAAARPAIVTAALAAVMEARLPDRLTWRPLGGGGSSGWEAVGSDGRHYALDTLTGEVLVDGYPPARLPRDITSHPLFVRVFGHDTNFEVARSDDGVLRALRPVGGRLYDFLHVPGAATGSSSSSGAAQGAGHLRVIEWEPREGGGVALELLNTGAEDDCAGWGGGLPVRLRRLYSHWLCRWGQAGDGKGCERQKEGGGGQACAACKALCRRYTCAASNCGRHRGKRISPLPRVPVAQGARRAGPPARGLPRHRAPLPRHLAARRSLRSWLQHGSLARAPRAKAPARHTLATAAAERRRQGRRRAWRHARDAAGLAVAQLRPQPLRGCRLHPRLRAAAYRGLSRSWQWPGVRCQRCAARQRRQCGQRPGVLAAALRPKLRAAA